MKTATYRISTEHGDPQRISIDYTFVPEPMNVISEWCRQNSLKSFDCIPSKRMAKDSFSWSYRGHGDGPGHITCFAERMT